jgi:hypothetical protein
MNGTIAMGRRTKQEIGKTVKPQRAVYRIWAGFHVADDDSGYLFVVASLH